MRFTKEDVEKVYDEIERRIDIFISEYHNEGLTVSDFEIISTRNDMLQGVYGTLMILADNWPDVRWWCDRVEEEKGW